MAGVTDVVGALAGFGSANPYGRASSGEWNLARGIYTRSDSKQIVFFFESAREEPRHQRTSLEQAQDTGGRRLAVYEYPYRDGQRIADLGRKGETIALQIKFFGLDYQQKLKEFIDVVYKSPLAGTLVHPVRGAMSVRLRDIDFLHRYDEWNSATIRATFLEDTTDQLSDVGLGAFKGPDAALRDGIQVLSSVQKFLTDAIGDANLVNVARSTLKNRLQAVVGQVSQLMGNLVSTFSSDAKLKGLAAQGASTSGGLTSLSSGTVTTGQGVQATLPALVQTGYDEQTQASIEAQAAAYVQASQITTQQAVFQANQARQSISAAITEIEQMLGIDAFDMVLAYRQLAIQIQEAVESSISATQSVVRLYEVPRAMSLRAVAYANGLTADQQNDIEALNPYLPSVNVVPAGTVLTLPVA